MIPRHSSTETAEVIPEWNIKQILVPIDFSDDSEKAMLYAANVAERYKAKLILVHVIPTIAPVYELGVEDRELEEELRASAETKLKDLITKKIDRSVEAIFEIDSGSPVEEIVTTAENLKVDLLITSTHGRTGLEALLLGSVAEGVIRYARCPVLVLRHRAQEMAGPFGIRTVLVALDFSECSELALQAAQYIAVKTHAKLVMTHIAPLHHPISEYGLLECPHLDAELMKAGQEYVRRLAEKAVQHGISAEWEVGQGKAGVELLNIAARQKVDLIVVGTRGLTGLQHVLFGSTAEYLVRNARCPVLVVRQRALQPSSGQKRNSIPVKGNGMKRRKDHDLLQAVVLTHPFLANMAREHLDILLKDAAIVEWEPGEIVFRESGYADKFYLIHTGKITLECQTPEEEVTIQTLGPNELLGWSWLFPPFAWHFQARALEKTVALQLNGPRILVAAEEDQKFGHHLMKRVAQVVIHRLQETRRRLVEHYEETHLELGDTL